MKDKVIVKNILTYTNPRLKHVKKIREVAGFISILGKPAIAKIILDQCNLLLEKATKKTKKECCSECMVLGVKDYKDTYGTWLHTEFPMNLCKNHRCSCHSTPSTEYKELKEVKCFDYPNSLSAAGNKK